jgi:hypothetical protein
VPGTTVDWPPAFHGTDLGAGLLVDIIDTARRVAALGRYTLQIVRASGYVSGRRGVWRSISRPCYAPGNEEGD